jgi:hypothetical protein
MSFLDKMKDAGDKAGKAIQKNYQEQQLKARERKEEKAKQLAIEQAEKDRQIALEKVRQQKILTGNIKPIVVSMNLQTDEKAYLELPAIRMASFDSIIEHNVGKSKKKGGSVVGRAIVGGVLLGPVGALGGAVTAKSKHSSTTTQQVVTKMEQVDSGQMILTNKRFIFIGNNNVISLTYPEIIATSFSGNNATIKYNGMLNSEHFVVNGPTASDTQLYYSGITQHIAKPAI